MANQTTEKMVLGSLMQNPTLLVNIEKYNLVNQDFNDKLNQYIFYAISSAAFEGAKSVTVQDIELQLQGTKGETLFVMHNGIDLLNDYIELSNLDNFDSYYKLLKKENLLRDLSSYGFDVSRFYKENPFTQEDYEINETYLDMDNSEIINIIRRSLLDIEEEYATSHYSKTTSVSDNIYEFLEDLENAPRVGLPLQGEVFNSMINGARRGTYMVRSADSGVGKALPNSTKIPTPLGWREVGEIRVGDYLFDALGKPTKVMGVFPQGKKEVWEVHFKDGRKAKSSPDHLWSYNTRKQRQKSKDERKFFTKTLKDIATEGLMSGQGYRVLVPQHHAVEYGEKKLPIPPYVLGLAIGDGSFRQHDSNKSFQFSSETDELPRVIADTMGYTLKKNSEHNYAWYFGSQEPSGGRKKNIWVEDFLKELPELMNTTSANKFIPEVYLYGSTEQRLELLNGLLDSDGTVDGKGRVRFYTNSAKLRDSVIELASSLGYFVSVSEDNHRKNVNYIIHITGTPELKNKLFKLERKRRCMDDWCNNGKRKEKNTHNPIVDIIDLGYEEDMTCFMVDNEEHLFLTEDFIVTHNTRSAVADACQLAYPIRYDWKRAQWIASGHNERVMVIITEQQDAEIKPMVLSYLSGINQNSIEKMSTLTKAQRQVLLQAAAVMETFRDNFLIVRFPEPTIQGIKNIIRNSVLKYDIAHVFYDYIFINPALLSEFKSTRLRNDEVLLMFSTALKDLAVELDIFVATSTQTSAAGDNNTNIRNGSSIAGSRAIVNKADIGCVLSRPTPEELKALKTVLDSIALQPNIVTDLYKNRNGQYTNVRIWSYFDMGTLQREDLFVTDARLSAIEYSSDNILFEFPVKPEIYKELLVELNGK